MRMIASVLTISTSISARDPHSKFLLATSLSTEHHSKSSGLGLNGHLDVSELDAKEGSNNTNGGNNEWGSTPRREWKEWVRRWRTQKGQRRWIQRENRRDQRPYQQYHQHCRRLCSNSSMLIFTKGLISLNFSIVVASA
jgi:hypothetical protein